MDSERRQKTAGNDSQDSVSQAPNRVWLVVLVALLIVAVALMAVACQPGEPEPTTEPPPEPSEPPPDEPVGINCEESEIAEELGRDSPAKNPYFMDREVIFTGPEGAIEKLIAELQTGTLSRGRSLTLNEVESCNIEGTGALQTATAMNLYKGDEGTSVVEVLKAVAQSDYYETVAVDPNYLVGLLGTSLCGSPHGVRPSPWKLAANPHGVRPSPVGTHEGFPTSLEALDLFRNQWAFGQIGLAPNSPVTGAGVRVGVLDTSPFPNTGAAPAAVVAATGLSMVELSATHGVTPSWELDLGFPTLRVPAAPATPDPPPDLSDHGLFVAGLIHALAPGSRVQLIRVLNEYGCGNLFTLNKTIHDFAIRAHADRKSLDGAVLNLSLGVQQPLPPSDPEDPPLTGDETVLIEDTIESLLKVVEHAVKKGVVVVAAAGNESYDGPSPLPPQLPAGHDQVIGVWGSNHGGTRSCFSNEGDVAAPAGDGVSGFDEDGNSHPCRPVQEGDCSGDCQTALISLVFKGAKGYAYWTGTSFATPLTSGLAAKVMDQGVLSAKWVSPADVQGAIICGKTAADVIDVPATLGGCMP